MGSKTWQMFKVKLFDKYLTDFTFRILTVLSSLQLMRTVARWAAMREYTPPEAPATYVLGSVKEVPREPARTPAR